VPEPESGRYAVATGGTARNLLLYLAGFREEFKDLWTASMSWRELRDVNRWVITSGPTPAIVQLLVLMEASFSSFSDPSHCHPNSQTDVDWTYRYFSVG
jgi:hypothetical protein